MGDRCRVYRIATDDLDRAVDDPAFALLLAEGWTVIAPIAVEEKNQVSIALIMAPPRVDPYQWKVWALAGMFGFIMIATSAILFGVQL